MFLRRQIRWSGNPISLIIFQSLLWSTVKGFSILNEVEVDAFPEFPCFLHDPMNVGNLISLSSSSSKSSSYISKFSVHILLKPSLKNFEDNLTSMWNEVNCVVVWTFFSIAFLWDWNENWPFQSYGHCYVFQICWHIECNILTASYFRIWSSSAGVPSPPLALFVVMIPKARLMSHSRMSGSRWVTTLRWLSGSLRPFLYSYFVYFSTSS